MRCDDVWNRKHLATLQPLKLWCCTEDLAWKQTWKKWYNVALRMLVYKYRVCGRDADIWTKLTWTLCHYPVCANARYESFLKVPATKPLTTFLEKAAALQLKQAHLRSSVSAEVSKFPLMHFWDTVFKRTETDDQKQNASEVNVGGKWPRVSWNLSHICFHPDLRDTGWLSNY